MDNLVAWFYNPVSGLGQFPANLDLVVESCQKVNFTPVFFRLSPNPEELSQIFQRTDFLQFHSLVAAGGDGTIHSVVNAMMNHKVSTPLAVYPSGTSNDLTNFLNIPAGIPAFVEMLTKGRCVPIDLGRVSQEYFINVASAGAITETAHEVDQVLKNTLGRAAYYIKGLEKVIKLRNFRMKIALDGETQDLEGFFFIILNGGIAGGVSLLTDIESISDGYLDIIVFQPQVLQKLLPLMLKLKQGKSILKHSAVFHARAKHLTISLDADTPTDLDGEPGPPLPWTVELLPKAMLMRLPGI